MEKPPKQKQTQMQKQRLMHRTTRTPDSSPARPAPETGMDTPTATRTETATDAPTASTWALPSGGTRTDGGSAAQASRRWGVASVERRGGERGQWRDSSTACGTASAKDGVKDDCNVRQKNTKT